MALGWRASDMLSAFSESEDEEVWGGDMACDGWMSGCKGSGSSSGSISTLPQLKLGTKKMRSSVSTWLQLLGVVVFLMRQYTTALWYTPCTFVHTRDVRSQNVLKIRIVIPLQTASIPRAELLRRGRNSMSAMLRKYTKTCATGPEKARRST